MKETYETFKKHLAGLGSVAVAFSGGVDSTFLLKAAQAFRKKHSEELNIEPDFQNIQNLCYL